jgi:ribonuclease HI
VLEFVDSKGVLHTRTLSQGYRKTTNNRMELMAAIAGLEALTKPCDVELWSDSQYLINAFNQHWIDGWLRKNWMRNKTEAVKNVDLWKRLIAAVEPHDVTYHWVRGHAGHAENERCDTLATTAADGSTGKVALDASGNLLSAEAAVSPQLPVAAPPAAEKSPISLAFSACSVG